MKIKEEIEKKLSLENEGFSITKNFIKKYFKKAILNKKC